MDSVATLLVQGTDLSLWAFFGLCFISFFGSLIAVFLNYKFEVPPALEELAALDVTLVGLNTFVLLTSSFTVVLGLSAIKQGDRGGLIRYMLLTLLLGAIFLGGQGYEFTQLFAEGVTLTSSLYGSSFFTLTSFHGLHVFIGLLWVLIVLFNGLRGAYSPDNYDGVEAFGLYWHFVDIVWIILFTIIYLI